MSDGDWPRSRAARPELWMNMAWIAPVVALAACDAPDPSSTAVHARFDSAGIQVVEYDLRDDAPALVLARTPTVTFASETQSFDWVWSFSESPDGRFLILGRSGGVRVFDSTGALEATVGRFGQGPAEFQQPWRAWWRDDGGLTVYDARGSALVHFSRDYAFEGRDPVPYLYSTNVMPLPSGHTLFTDEHWDSTEVGYDRDYNTVRVVTPSGDSIVWAHTVAGDGRFTSSVAQVARGSVSTCPYAHDALLAAMGTLVVSEATAPRTTLLVSGVDGTVTRILRRPGEALPPPSPERMAFAVAEFRYHVPESQWEQFDPTRCDMPTVAEVSRILADPGGDLWMARERTFPAFEARAWDRVSLDGDHSATLALHPHFRVLEFGDGYVLGVLTTEIGEVLPLVFAIEQGRVDPDRE